MPCAHSREVATYLLYAGLERGGTAVRSLNGLAKAYKERLWQPRESSLIP